MVKAFFSIVLVICLCACSSTRYTDGGIIKYQAEIDRLENELHNRDRAIDNAVRELESISARSSEMEGTIDELIELFDEYQRAVERLLHDYRATENENKDTIQDSISFVPSFVDSNLVHGCRFYMLCEGCQVATVAGYTFVGVIYDTEKIHTEVHRAESRL